MNQSSSPASFFGAVAIRLLVLFALLLIFRPPIVSTPCVVAFLILAAYLCFSRFGSNSPKKAGLILGAVTALSVLAYWLPSAKIEEGHNLLLFVDEDSAAMREALPPEIYAWARRNFHETYPSAQRCPAEHQGCWLGYGEIQRPFAFSADGALQKPLWSRQVRSFNFDSAANGRFGFLNSSGAGDLNTNWYSTVGTPADPERKAIPFFVRYRFDTSAAGGRLCWQGSVALENLDGTFDIQSEIETNCRILETNTLPMDVVGLQISAANRLSMSFEPSSSQRLWTQLREILQISAASLLVFGLFRSATRVVFPVILVSIASAITFNISHVWSEYRYPEFTGGHDTLTHWGYGRWILESAVAGDWYQALQGIESTYYYMPGYRYFRALEMWVFGDSGMLSFAFVMATPVIIYLLARKLLPILPSALITAAVLATRSYPEKVENLAEAVAYPLALCGLLNGIRGMDASDREGQPWWWLSSSALLLAVAVLMRPNLLPAAGLYLIFLWWTSLSRGFWPASLSIGFGFTPCLLLLAHNLYFGGEWVLLTKAGDISVNLQIPPAMYGNAINDLLVGDFHSNALSRVGHHLNNWLTIGGGSYLLLSSGVLLFMALSMWLSDRWKDFGALIRNAFDRPLISLLIFTTGLQGVLLFYQSAGRYGMLAQISSLILLVVLLWRILSDLKRGN